MAMKPDALPGPHGFGDNVVKYHRYLRDNDVYVVYRGGGAAGGAQS